MTRRYQEKTTVEASNATVGLDQLDPDPQNARRHGKRNLAAIEASLREHGQVLPLVVVRRGDRYRLVGGHGTVAVMRRLGWTEAWVSVYDSEDDAQAARLGLRLNRTAELAEWDGAVLGPLLAQHGNELGWTDTEIAALMEPEKRQTGTASAVRGAQHLVIQGDSSTDETLAQVAEAIAGRSYVAIIDPPYEAAESVWLHLLHDPCIVFGQAKHIRKIPEELWRFERVLVKARAHRSATVAVGHQHAFVAQCGTAKILPADGLTSPSVIEIPWNDRYRKPPELIAEHLRRWTPAVDLVVDWFGGTGASIEAASMVGLPCIAVERDEDLVARLQAMV